MQLGKSLLCTLPSFNDKTNFGFQLTYFCAGFVQQTLRLIDLISRGVVGLSNSFKIGFDVTQVGNAGFQINDSLVDICLDFDLIRFSIGTLEEPKLLLFESAVGFKVIKALSHFGLFFQLFQIGIEFTQDVFNTRQVLARVRQTIFGFPASLFVFRNTSGLFQKQTQFFRPRFNDSADGALANDGISARAQSCSQKHILHVATTHGLVVDVVTAVAIAG